MSKEEEEEEEVKRLQNIGYIIFISVSVFLGLFYNYVFLNLEIEKVEYQRINYLKNTYPELNSTISRCMKNDNKITIKEFHEISNQTEEIIERLNTEDFKKMKEGLK